MKNGVILINKPAGISTFDIIRILRKKLGIKKMGHAGVLDKMATGLVVIATNKATKLLSIFEEGYKIYEAEFTFGKETDTYDSEGMVLENKSIDSIPESELLDTLNEFKGKIKQTPPPFSNVKVNGERLYKYALKRQYVKVPKRVVTIYSLELLGIYGNKARLRIKCSKGTYIRALAHDIGKKLGYGAIVSSLKRIYIHPFSIEQSSTLDSPKIIPIIEALRFMDEIVVDSSAREKIINGYPICKLLNCSKLKGKFYKLIDTKTNLVAVIEKKDLLYSYKLILK